MSSYISEEGYKEHKPSEEHGKELPISSQYNKANIKRLSDKELRILIDSDNISQHLKKLAFDELTNRNKAKVKKLRRGNNWQKRKPRRDLSGMAEKK